MRVLADHQPDQYARVLQWPVREACLAFEHHLREAESTAYREDLLRYVILAPWSKDMKPPKMPAILKDA